MSMGGGAMGGYAMGGYESIGAPVVFKPHWALSFSSNFFGSGVN